MPTAVLSDRFYSAKEAEAIDRFVIEQSAVPGIRLMEKAGEAAWQWLNRCYPSARRILVLVGAGNNGGDGYVLARLAHAAGRQVQVLSLSSGAALKNEAALAYAGAKSAQVSIEPFSPQTLLQADVIVDALFGVGLDRPVTGDYAKAIEAMNTSAAPVFSLDVPSGLCASTGAVLGCCVKAQCTLSFIVPKIGLVTGLGPDYTGSLAWDALGVAPQTVQQVAKGVRHYSPAHVAGLPPRVPSSHKGSMGHVVVLGGAQGMGGAALMAAEAALASGAGKVSLVTHPDHVSAALSRAPEVMVHGVAADASILSHVLPQANVMVLGPGLGTKGWGKQIAEQVVLTMRSQSLTQLVLDADGLNLLAKGALNWVLEWGKRVILTPHPGEALRLLGATNDHAAYAHLGMIEADRLKAIESLVRAYGATCILKGAGSLVAHLVGETVEIGICTAGNPGMAVGGMGDVLSGLLGALLAQGLSPSHAAALGVTAHAAAADHLWDDGRVVSVRPSHLIAELSCTLPKMGFSVGEKCENLFSAFHLQ